jgi:hypothetical protein
LPNKTRGPLKKNPNRKMMNIENISSKAETSNILPLKDGSNNSL